jgi:hypothetical protein
MDMQKEVAEMAPFVLREKDIEDSIASLRWLIFDVHGREGASLIERWPSHVVGYFAQDVATLLMDDMTRQKTMTETWDLPAKEWRIRTLEPCSVKPGYWKFVAKRLENG